MRSLITCCAMLLVALVMMMTAPRVFAVDADGKVSLTKDVMPIFKKACIGCHHPGKLKGKLDLTTYATIVKGGKTGAGLKPGEPDASEIVKAISGPEPDMPEDGDPLSKEQVDIIARWIRQGAVDDTPKEQLRPAGPTVYHAPPVVTSIVYSPDGSLLAVTGYYEVLLYKSDGSELVARLMGDAPRIESIAFSPDGSKLAVAGGAPARYGSVQVWNIADHKQLNSWRFSHDSLYGVSWSPDGTKLAFGAADNVARVINVADGKEIIDFKNHADWVFATVWSADGKQIISGSRDKAMKIIDLETTRFVDDINNPLEPVLCMARHPKENVITYGGGLGTPRTYKISDNQGRTAARNDTNLTRAFERQPGPVYAIAYSPDGALIAVGSIGGEVRLYKSADGARVATCSGHEGAVFAVTFTPDGKLLATGGYDGQVRLFDVTNGNLIKAFSAAPITAK